jgi:predicted amidohydrolase YtcJ
MAMSSAETDLVFASGKVRTPAHPSGFVQALAVRGGVIQALGSDDEMKELTVLDQDLYAIPARDIGDTSVVMTVADGTVVYGDR